MIFGGYLKYFDLSFHPERSNTSDSHGKAKFDQLYSDTLKRTAARRCSGVIIGIYVLTNSLMNIKEDVQYAKMKQVESGLLFQRTFYNSKRRKFAHLFLFLLLFVPELPYHGSIHHATNTMTGLFLSKCNNRNFAQ